MVKCNVPNDPDKKGNLEERCDGPASDVYYQSEGIEDDTGVKIPTEDAVEEAKDWSEENKKQAVGTYNKIEFKSKTTKN